MTWADVGPPLVVAAIVAFAVAFATRFTWTGFIGALIAVPLCLYLKDMPYLQWVSLAGKRGRCHGVVAAQERHWIRVPFAIHVADCADLDSLVAQLPGVHRLSILIS